MNGKKRLTIIISILAAALLISGYMYFRTGTKRSPFPVKSR